MNFLKPKETPATAAPPSPPQHFLQQTLTSLQVHFSRVFQNLQPKPLIRTPFYASVSNGDKALHGMAIAGVGDVNAKNYAMSAQAIDERLAGVPVFALSNGAQEFVLVSGTNTGKNLGLFCFSEADAEMLLKQMKSVDPSMSSDSRVVPVALSKVFQLKVDGVALRLLPEVSQIRNAMKVQQERKGAGVSNGSFQGVPVFQELGYLRCVLNVDQLLTGSQLPNDWVYPDPKQSRSLILRSQNKRYRPVFFRKEDLEKSLFRASRDQRQLNPILKGDIQVAVLEDIIRGMKDSSVSSWDDVVFVPPGFDVSTDSSQQY